MRLRIKFTKTGSMKYLSHLDMMRYFQKVLRRADFDVCLSEGFSPHMIMSFALPLSLGMESYGEYFDVDVKACDSTEEMLVKLNKQMCDEITVESVISIPEDKANKCMSLVTAADYIVEYDADAVDEEKLSKAVEDFIKADEIIALRKTKRSEEETNIRPFVHGMKVDKEAHCIKLRAGAGGVTHVKCELVMKIVFSMAGIDMEDLSLRYIREELLSDKWGKLLPLCKMGEVVA